MSPLSPASPCPDRIPHTCVHCQKDTVEPTTEKLWPGSGFDTKYSFQTDGEGALVAAAGGCAFWQWFIRDFLDPESQMLRNPRYAPNQC